MCGLYLKGTWRRQGLLNAKRAGGDLVGVQGGPIDGLLILNSRRRTEWGLIGLFSCTILYIVICLILTSSKQLCDFGESELTHTTIQVN